MEATAVVTYLIWEMASMMYKGVISISSSPSSCMYLCLKRYLRSTYYLSLGICVLRMSISLCEHSGFPLRRGSSDDRWAVTWVAIAELASSAVAGVAATAAAIVAILDVSSGILL